MRSQVSTLACVILLSTLVVSGCAALDGTPPPETRSPLARRPDGERGHGWFVTAWGLEEIDYVWRGGQRVYDGDLALDETEREVPTPPPGQSVQALLSVTRLRWDMGSSGVVTIPYEIANTGGLGAALFDQTAGRIRRAMDHWETYARRPGGGQLFRFELHNGQPRYVQFQVKQSPYCYTSLLADGRSHVDSDPGCLWQTYVHEIGHLLTFRHEQRRLDRADYVIFHADRTNQDGEFSLVGGNMLGTAYDTRSIMHYPSCMFHILPCTSSTPDGWVIERRTGERYIESWSARAISEVLSPTDVCGVRTLYGLPCVGDGTGADAGVMDAGVMDAGVMDAGAGDAGSDGGPSAGISFPVSVAMAGMLQRVATGECAAPAGTGIGLVTCDVSSDMHRWGLAPTQALRNQGSGRCAAPTSAVDGAPVEQRDCAPDDVQRWHFGDVEVVNGSSGTCITVPSADYSAGQQLVHRACTGATNQRFAFNPATHQIIAEGWCLTAGDSAGGLVELRACDDNPRQRWIETNGGFAAGGLCLHIRGGATSPSGAPIDMADCNALVGQMWGLRGRVAHFNDELCLSPTGTAAPLALATCTSSEAMIWWPRRACIPLTCADLGASCGSFDDGCGSGLECGACATTPVDDAGPGAFEQCIPLACADLGEGACGTVSDNCGGMQECGPCPRSTGACGCRAAGSGHDGRGPILLAALALATCATRRRRARLARGFHPRT